MIGSPRALPTPLDPQVARLLDAAESLVLVNAEQALAHCDEALSLARQSRDQRGEAAALTLHGHVLHFLSRDQEAIEEHLLARTLAREAGDTATEARALNGLGNASRMLGRYDQCMEYYLESLRLAQEHGDDLGRLRAVNNIGLIHWQLHEYELALQAHLTVRDEAKRLSFGLVESGGTVNAIIDYHFLGRHEQSLALAEAHLPVLRDKGLRQHEVVLQTYRALSLLESGQLDDAVKLTQEIEALVDAVQDQTYVALNAMTQARGLRHLGDFERAEALLQRALHVTKAHGLRSYERDAYRYLSELRAELRDWQSAYTFQAAYHELERSLHRQDVDQKVKVLSAQLQVDMLRREADAERIRNVDLAQANLALRELGEAQQALNDQLRRANEELDAFSYSISHDLRAPIRHISSFALLLRKALGGEMNAQVERYLGIIEDSATRMNTLVDALLGFARQSREPLRVTTVDLNALVHRVKQDLSADLGDRRVRWELHDLPSVQGDAALLGQVVFNLLANAVTYTRTRDEAVIRVWAESGNGECSVHVQDNGVGFDPRLKAKLFGVFQRLHRQEEFEGTGVGLANVQRIVARHGGRVWAEGEIGKGATFSFTLPT